jgi:2-methylcitrate dehydratase PrpD
LDSGQKYLKKGSVLMNTTRELARYCAGLRFEHFPEEVIEQVKYLALDFLGVTIRGYLEESSKTMLRLVQCLDPVSRDSTLISQQIKSSPHYAALANGTSAHSLELDDVNNEASLHPGVTIFPAALALSEAMDSSGKTFIMAIVLGYEVAVRLGKALNPSLHYAQGFHPTGTCGIFGAAAASAAILALSEEQIIDAFGICGSQAAASMEFLHTGAWTKRMHPGWAAHNGIIAAKLAREGFKGPATILEGRYGFLQSYSSKPDLTLITADLGTTFEIMHTSIKPHACCRYKQACIDCILSLVKEFDIKPQDVHKVTLELLETGFPLIAEPAEVKYNPKNIVDAQFSMPFGAAVAILKRRAFLDEYQIEYIESPQVQELMQKVICIKNPELGRYFPKYWPGRAVIETITGKTYEKEVINPKGDPENPLSWEELEEKFDLLTHKIYSQQRRKEILNKIKNLEQIDMKTLCLSLI